MYYQRGNDYDNRLHQSAKTYWKIFEFICEEKQINKSLLNIKKVIKKSLFASDFYFCLIFVLLLKFINKYVII